MIPIERLNAGRAAEVTVLHTLRRQGAITMYSGKDGDRFDDCEDAPAIPDLQVALRSPHGWVSIWVEVTRFASFKVFLQHTDRVRHKVAQLADVGRLTGIATMLAMVFVRESLIVYAIGGELITFDHPSVRHNVTLLDRTLMRTR